MAVAVLSLTPLSAAYALRPLRVAWNLGWCDHEYPRWGGHNPSSRARHTGFSHGSELSSLLGSDPSLCPAPMPQGVSYVRYEHEPANPYIRKHNAHQSTSGPLPCTIEAITRSGTDIPSSRPTGPFSPNVVEKTGKRPKLAPVLLRP